MIYFKLIDHCDTHTANVLQGLSRDVKITWKQRAILFPVLMTVLVSGAHHRHFQFQLALR